MNALPNEPVPPVTRMLDSLQNGHAWSTFPRRLA